MDDQRAAIERATGIVGISLSAYEEGFYAALNGGDWGDNPFYHNTNESESWDAGFIIGVKRSEGTIN